MRVSRPFSVPTSELFRQQGVRHPVTIAGRVDDVALSSVRLTGDDVVADVVLEAHGDTVTVSGTVVAHWVGDCRRCLDETHGDVVVELSEVFEPDPVDGETYGLGRDDIDAVMAWARDRGVAGPLHDKVAGVVDTEVVADPAVGLAAEDPESSRISVTPSTRASPMSSLRPTKPSSPMTRIASRST